ncbi:MAG TPA: peptidoglycan-binding protein, partial [Hyphomicrobiaceae bacterium]|nr:peptidoglycan-binding protein [Hyphomicrobiaceae bacterium]
MRLRARFWRTARLGLAGVAALAALAEPGAAQGASNAWMRALQPSYAPASTSETTEREFIRDWEMNPAKGFPTLSPNNVGPTKAAIARYAAIAAKGGWRRIPDVKLQQGDTHAAVVMLRARLRLSGELKDEDTSDYFDYELGQAIRRYQQANGLAPTGTLDKSTLAAMNVPAASRLKQLRASLARMTELGKAPRKYIVVNIPAAQIEAVENDAVVSRH